MANPLLTAVTRFVRPDTAGPTPDSPPCASGQGGGCGCGKADSPGAAVSCGVACLGTALRAVTTPAWWQARRAELLCAHSFFTRLPPPLAPDAPPLGACVWAFPVAGALVGLIGGLVLWIASGMGLPALPAGILALAVMTLASGALHEDGLSDTADGLGGGWTRDQALEIMRDSRIGAYGAVALILVMGLRAALLAVLVASGSVALMLAGPLVAGALGRAGCGLILGLLPPARHDGLGQGAGTPDPLRLGAGLILAAGAALVLLPPLAGGLALLAAAVPVLLLARMAQRRLGGQTGDIAGAAALLAECGVLLVLAVAAAGLGGGLAA